MCRHADSTLLKRPLRDRAEYILDEVRIKQDGFLDTAVDSQAMARSCQQRYAKAGDLWNLLPSQAWCVAESEQWRQLS